MAPIKRRTFMASTVACATLPTLGALAATIGRDWQQLDRFIYDERFDFARAVAAEVSSCGGRIFAISGDITALWYGDLYHRWRSGTTHLAGLTLESAAAQLAHFSRDGGHALRYVTSEDGDTGFGRSIVTSLLTEALTPLRLVPWVIVPRATS